MTLKTGPDERHAFFDRHRAGETYAEIAATAGVSAGCVRYWCRRLRKGGSSETHYHQPVRGLLSQFDPLVRYHLLRLRLEHPRWGPGRLRFALTQVPSLKCRGLRLPGLAQIGRYLRQWPRLHRRPKPPRPHLARPDPPTRVHQRWQLDFKLGLPLGDGTQVNLHTLYDPVGEVCLAARVTPAGPAGHRPTRVSVDEVCDTLRAGFARWQTLPEQVQTDHEAVFVGNTDAEEGFPGRFTLWLAGLGIEHLTIRPGQPTDNAEVERCHQTLCDYAAGRQPPPDDTQLQATLDTALERLAFDLPSRAEGCHGQPPVQAHPELLQPARLFVPAQEAAWFDLGRVDRYLAGCLWRRRVGKTGQITLGYHHAYSVGRRYAGQTVAVAFDPADRHFVFFATQPPYAELGRRPARGLDPATLSGRSAAAGLAWPHQLTLFDLAAEGVNC